MMKKLDMLLSSYQRYDKLPETGKFREDLKQKEPENCKFREEAIHEQPEPSRTREEINRIREALV